MLLITSALNTITVEALRVSVGQLPGTSYLESVTTPQGAEHVQKFLNVDEANRVLILVEFAADALANAMQQGNDALSQQAQQWKHSTEALLTLHKLDRKRIRLVSLQSAQYDPHALQTDFGVAINFPQANPEHSLNSILASQWLTSQQELAVLDQRLRASSKCYNEAALIAQTATTAAESNAQQRYQLAEREQQLATVNTELAQSQKNNSELKEENELLLNQLHQVQEELEQNFMRTNDLESKFAEQQKDNKLLSEKIERGRGTDEIYTELKEENELLIMQLHNVHEELERYFLAGKNEKNTLKLNDTHAHELEQLNENMLILTRKLNRDRVKLQQVQGSFSWKLTKIFRAAKRLYPKVKIAEQVKHLKASDLFDEHWYLQSYPDVAKAGLDAAIHYLRHGAKEGRNPGPTFDTEWYLRQYPDVKQAKMNPLVHYILFGIEENRKVSPRLLTHQA